MHASKFNWFSRYRLNCSLYVAPYVQQKPIVRPDSVKQSCWKTCKQRLIVLICVFWHNAVREIACVDLGPVRFFFYIPGGWMKKTQRVYPALHSLQWNPDRNNWGIHFSWWHRKAQRKGQDWTVTIIREIQATWNPRLLMVPTQLHP